MSNELITDNVSQCLEALKSGKYSQVTGMLFKYPLTPDRYQACSYGVVVAEYMRAVCPNLLDIMVIKYCQGRRDNLVPYGSVIRKWLWGDNQEFMGVLEKRHCIDTPFAVIDDYGTCMTMMHANDEGYSLSNISVFWERMLRSL